MNAFEERGGGVIHEPLVGRPRGQKGREQEKEKRNKGCSIELPRVQTHRWVITPSHLDRLLVVCVCMFPLLPSFTT